MLSTSNLKTYSNNLETLSDKSGNLGALMDDALRVHQAVGGTDRDVVIGHDWGALTATGLAV